MKSRPGWPSTSIYRFSARGQASLPAPRVHPSPCQCSVSRQGAASSKRRLCSCVCPVGEQAAMWLQCPTTRTANALEPRCPVVQQTRPSHARGPLGNKLCTCVCICARGSVAGASGWPASHCLCVFCWRLLGFGARWNEAPTPVEQTGHRSACWLLKGLLVRVTWRAALLSIPGAICGRHEPLSPCNAWHSKDVRGAKSPSAGGRRLAAPGHGLISNLALLRSWSPAAFLVVPRHLVSEYWQIAKGIGLPWPRPPSLKTSLPNPTPKAADRNNPIGCIFAIPGSSSPSSQPHATPLGNL